VSHYLEMLADIPAKEAKEAKEAPLNSHNSQSDTQEELRGILGDDYAEIAKHPEQLAAFAHAHACRKMRLQGVPPEHYTSTATCHFCGPIIAPRGFESCMLGSCWWCANRRLGLHIPRPPTGDA